jgi:hypothetical protein
MSYEGKMARSSLRKTVAYATELLSIIKPTDELEPWVQNKINDMDHYIEAVYGYYKFGEALEESEDESMDEMMEESEDDEEDEDENESSDMQVTVGDYTTRHFDICPSAVELYSNIQGKTDMIHLVVETMMLQDLFFRLEKQAMAMGSIDSEELAKAQHYADMIMSNAKLMGLADEHSYIEDVHMAKFKQLAGMPQNTEDMDNNETFKIVLTPES